MTNRTEPFPAGLIPPQIDPVPDGIPRPLWSVMIPTYNCAQYLRHTLESVLAQDPGADQMQIEVVDDCSMLDDPAAVVREVGRDRVCFYQKTKNEGAIANFNTCIKRSTGSLVHILHGDDWIAPGFYDVVGRAFSAHQDAWLISTRVFFVDENDIISGVTKRLPKFESSPCDDTTPFWFSNPLQFAGVVVRREAYEVAGGFLPALVHTADWEMWARLISRGSGIVLPVTLGGYREFAGNDTSRLRTTAENLRDRQRLGVVFSRNYSNFPRKAFLRFLSRLAEEQFVEYRRKGDNEAAFASKKVWSQTADLWGRVRYALASAKRLVRADV
jgi:glycosyltransferase involved in cell wall biosynthesis